jgi:ketosteroid isomerase-like protein
VETMGIVSELAWSYFELMGQGKLDEALDMLSDGGTFWGIRTRRLIPTPEMKVFIRRVFDKVPMTFTLHDAMEDGNRAILELESHAIRTDGNAYNNLYCIIITIFGGKILHVREYLDTGVGQEAIDFISA